MNFATKTVITCSLWLSICGISNASLLVTLDIGFFDNSTASITYIDYQDNLILYGDGIQDGYLPGPDRLFGTFDDTYIESKLDPSLDPWLHIYGEFELLSVSGAILSLIPNYDPSKTYWGLKHYTSYNGLNSDITYYTDILSWWDGAASSYGGGDEFWATGFYSNCMSGNTINVTYEPYTPTSPVPEGTTFLFVFMGIISLILKIKGSSWFKISETYSS